MPLPMKPRLSESRRMHWLENRMLRPPASEPRGAFIDLAIALAHSAGVELLGIHESAAEESLVVELSMDGHLCELRHAERGSPTASLACRLPQVAGGADTETPQELLVMNRSLGDAGFAIDEDDAPVFIQTFTLAAAGNGAALLQTLRSVCERRRPAAQDDLTGLHEREDE